MIQRFPVTNRAYLEFLNELVAAGREEEALAACPRPHPSMPQSPGELIYERDRGGFFGLRAVAGDASGHPWQPGWPVVLVDWHGASAYARWLSARSGRSVRLLNELEREKAARGADGRLYPWGHHFDATWACVIDRHEGDPSRADVESYPRDESPWGVRGLAGNVRDWCENAWRREGPEIRGGRLLIPRAPAGDGALIAVRGGAWTSSPERSRSAVRSASRQGLRWTTTGFRLGWGCGRA